MGAQCFRCVLNDRKTKYIDCIWLVIRGPQLIHGSGHFSLGKPQKHENTVLLLSSNGVMCLENDNFGNENHVELKGKQERLCLMKKEHVQG